MSRFERLQNKKKNKRTIYYPVLAGGIMMFLLLILVDYRINNAMGFEKVRIIDINNKNDLVSVNLFGNRLGSIDISYLKDDIVRIRSNTLIIVRALQDSIENNAKEVFEQY